MPEPSLGMELFNLYKSSPSDCVTGAIWNTNKHKKILVVNKTVLTCLLGCRNCLGRCMSAYSFKHSMVGGCYTYFHRPHRHTTFAALQPQLASIIQIKNKSNQQAKFHNKKILNFLIYFYSCLFPPMGKRVPCSRCRQPEVLECKAVKITGTTVQNTYKQAKGCRKKKLMPKCQVNYKKKN